MGWLCVAALEMDGDDDDDDSPDGDASTSSGEEETTLRSASAQPQPQPPSLWRVLRANVIIFLYTLPLNLFSVVLLYGVTTMALSEMLNTQVPHTHIASPPKENKQVLL